MRVFLAGATGAVGRVLLPLLLDAGHQVVAASRTPAGVERLRGQGATGVQLDVLDPAAVVRALTAAEPDAVLHQLTALSDYDLAANTRIRTEGTRNLVDAALKAGARRIVAQSIAFAYEPGGSPADESTPLDLTAPESRATTVAGVRALEDAVAELPHHVVLRYGALYGPGTWYAPGGLMADRLQEGRLRADDGVSSFVHVGDAARAAVDALGWPSGVVNVVDDEPAAAREWVPVLAAALGVPAPEPVGGRTGWERGARNAAARALGWQPRHPTWRTGFAAQD
ncbi:NAD-dependent epimerase/dehydratase family protein [Streptacidiphilus griseoplanus]|uniref:NAD-dependent epimerase/dehydratase family protein n=1 Tax=Peterkaempfera griseoplana TaxID=66896 RepID=UPI0006E2D0B9|nr:NAD-dependent epimerase/dehydratase family protein [Peterkaempfera griseoplana]